MEKTWLIVGVVVGIVAASFMFGTESMSTGKISDMYGQVNMVTDMTMSATKVVFKESFEVKVVVKVKNEGETGSCQIVIRDVEGNKLKTDRVWLKPGHEKEVNILLKVLEDSIDSVDDDDLYQELKVEVRSRQKDEWVKTDEGTLTSDQYQFLVQGIAVKKEK